MTLDFHSIGEALIRWAHVVAGVAWIGHLYFFNFVNANFEKTLTDPAVKKGVIPELRPRALWIFRWGAAWTWVTGLLLLIMVFYMGGAMFEQGRGGTAGVAAGILIGALVVIYLYDVVAKSFQAKPLVAYAISLALLVGLYIVMRKVGHFGTRSLFIHVGAILGTAMAFNVWMRIWPSQRKIITAIKEGTAPDGAWVALAGARSRQNTFMSVPLLFLMPSFHTSAIYGTSSPVREIMLAVIFLLGFGVVNWLYKKSAAVPGF